MVNVVAERGHEEGELVQRPEQRVDLRGADDRKGRVADADRVREAVERVR